MTVALREPVHVMSDCLDSLRGSLSGLDDKAIAQTLRDIEVLSRQTHAVMLELVAEADSRAIAAREGFGGTARLLAGMLNLSAAEARTRVEHAVMVGTRRTIPATPCRLGCPGPPPRWRWRDRDRAATGDHRDDGRPARLSPRAGTRTHRG